MSLLTGSDVLQVTAEVETTDARRNTVRAPGDTTTPVHGRMQPVSSEESAAEGQQVSTLYRFITGEPFPGGPWAAVTWNERPFDIVGEPAVRGDSPMTAHTTVLLRARAPRGPEGG